MAMHMRVSIAMLGHSNFPAVIPGWIERSVHPSPSGTVIDKSNQVGLYVSASRISAITSR